MYTTYKEYLKQETSLPFEEAMQIWNQIAEQGEADVACSLQGTHRPFFEMCSRLCANQKRMEPEIAGRERTGRCGAHPLS